MRFLEERFLVDEVSLYDDPRGVGMSYEPGTIGEAGKESKSRAIVH